MRARRAVTLTRWGDLWHYETSRGARYYLSESLAVQAAVRYARRVAGGRVRVVP
jgi:hypothetical protein